MDDPALSRFPKNFKAPSLSSYDGKSDPVEHITVFNTRMAVVGAADSLKCKLLAGTLCDASMWWYMNLPRFSIVGYQDMTRKLIQQFSTSRHHKVSSTSLFKIRQKENETSQDYLTRFNDATIKVSNPNQKLFVEAFQNGLRAGQFNESLAQKPADLMEEIMARAECCIKGEESNVEKKARDSKERGTITRQQTGTGELSKNLTGGMWRPTIQIRTLYPLEGAPVTNLQRGLPLQADPITLPATNSHHGTQQRCLVQKPSSERTIY